MRRFLTFGLYSLLTASVIGISGCGGGEGPKQKGNVSADSHASDDGHDHHDHPTEGPHHGHLIELGKEEFHAELTDDDATKTVTIYILDSAAKSSVPIDAKEVMLNLAIDGKPVQFALPAAPLPTDPPEKSSCFQLADERLIEGLDAKGAKGRINVTINGKSFSGNIEHHAHGDHKD
jgi:hypothetical protein